MIVAPYSPSRHRHRQSLIKGIVLILVLSRMFMQAIAAAALLLSEEDGNEAADDDLLPISNQQHFIRVLAVEVSSWTFKFWLLQHPTIIAYTTCTLLLNALNSTSVPSFSDDKAERDDGPRTGNEWSVASDIARPLKVVQIQVVHYYILLRAIATTATTVGA